VPLTEEEQEEVAKAFSNASRYVANLDKSGIDYRLIAVLMLTLVLFVLLPGERFLSLMRTPISRLLEKFCSV